MIVASVIGGMVIGPVIGAVNVYIVRQALQGRANWATFINGVLIVAATRFGPRPPGAGRRRHPIPPSA